MTSISASIVVQFGGGTRATLFPTQQKVFEFAQGQRAALAQAYGLANKDMIVSNISCTEAGGALRTVPVHWPVAGASPRHHLAPPQSLQRAAA